MKHTKLQSKLNSYYESSKESLGKNSKYLEQIKKIAGNIGLSHKERIRRINNWTTYLNKNNILNDSVAGCIEGLLRINGNYVKTTSRTREIKNVYGVREEIAGLRKNIRTNNLERNIEYPIQSNENKLPTEISAVFGAYTRTNLSKFNIIQELNKGVFIKTKPIDIPILSLLFCIFLFRESKFSGSSALAIKDICQHENSPGLVFNLPEYKIREDLENLQYSELIRIEIFGNLDQVRFSDSLSQEFILNRIYRISNGN